jgi:hypothetical protein
LKFSIKRSAYDDQLRELRHYNDSLSQLTGKSLSLEPSRRRSTPNFKAFQDYAKTIFHTLCSSLQCTCQSHAVNLRIEHRDKLDADGSSRAPSAPLRFVFTNSLGVSSQLPPLWKEVELRCFEDLVQAAPIVTPRDCSTHNAKRKVRFSMTKPQRIRVPSAPVVETTAAVSAALPTSASIPQVAQIESLCAAIAQIPPQHDKCVGYLLDDTQQRHGLYSRPSKCSPQQWVRCTLAQVLSGSAGHTAPLSLRDKLRIAVDLASGVLQLYKTPWLREDWTQSDVIFIYRPGSAEPSMYEHPFVYRELSQLAPQQIMNTSPTVYRVIRNRTLYVLGIVLIELCYGKLIQGLQKAEDLQCDGAPGVEWCTADRLLRTKELENHVGKRYADAVRRCIYCDFGVDDADLDNEGFQRVVYEGVLEKLEESLRHIEG